MLNYQQLKDGHHAPSSIQIDANLEMSRGLDHFYLNVAKIRLN